MSKYHLCKFCHRKHLGLSPNPSELCIQNLKRDIRRLQKFEQERDAARKALIELAKIADSYPYDFMHLVSQDTLAALQAARA